MGMSPISNTTVHILTQGCKYYLLFDAIAKLSRVPTLLWFFWLQMGRIRALFCGLTLFIISMSLRQLD